MCMYCAPRASKDIEWGEQSRAACDAADKIIKRLEDEERLISRAEAAKKVVLSENDGIKELKQLVDGTCKILGVDKVSQITGRLAKVVVNGEIEVYQAFKNMVGGDLDTDWVQMIFQYYMADRKEKMQDFTPKSVAKLMARLAGKADVVTDMCAGTGALTIQKWSVSKEEYRILRDADEEVIPWLLFNMAIRNIDCEVYLEDVLTQKLKRVYRVVEGEQFGECEVMYDDSVHIEPTV